MAYLRWQGQLEPLREVLRRLPSDATTFGQGGLSSTRALLSLLDRDADGLLRELERSRVEVYQQTTSFMPKALWAGWAHELRNDPVAARAAFEEACARLDAAAKELPGDWRVHAARGLALAALGQRDEALREAAWLQQSDVYREDAYFGSNVILQRAWVLARTGQAEAAIDEAERLLSRPSAVTVHILRLDPRWDPVRSHPRFKALLAKYSSAGEAR
jgi:tetratricopeptide (TPR) repeat protein